MSLLKATPAESRFSITVLEIPDIRRGAGLAIILRTPAGKTWLYDTGTAYPERLSSNGWLANFNAGRDLIAPLLKKHGITEIDGIFISHSHYDHFGGLIWLKDHFPIRKLIDSGYTYSSENPEDYRGTNREELEHYTRIREEFRLRGSYQAVTAGEVIDIDPELQIRIIAPPKNFFSDPKVERGKNDSPSHYLVNSNPLSIRVQHRELVFYFPGDIQSEDLNLNLLPSVDHSLLKCDVLIAPGHGIHCTPEFAQATRPKNFHRQCVSEVCQRHQKYPHVKSGWRLHLCDRITWQHRGDFGWFHTHHPCGTAVRSVAGKD